MFKLRSPPARSWAAVITAMWGSGWLADTDPPTSPATVLATVIMAAAVRVVPFAVNEAAIWAVP